MAGGKLGESKCLYVHMVKVCPRPKWQVENWGKVSVRLEGKGELQTKFTSG